MSKDDWKTEPCDLPCATSISDMDLNASQPYKPELKGFLTICSSIKCVHSGTTANTSSNKSAISPFTCNFIGSPNTCASSSQKRFPYRTMAIRMPRIVPAKQFRRWSSFTIQSGAASAAEVPKGCFAVYVGEEGEKKRFVIPIAYLNDSLFQDLLVQAEEEFGFEHPMGRITIPCREDVFVNIICRLS